MLNNKHAIVILYSGSEMPDYIGQKIGELLITSGLTIPENVTIVYKDQESVSKALIRDAINTVPSIKFETKNSDDLAEAIKSAIIYIGERFKGTLANANGNMVLFVLELTSALMEERDNNSFNFLNLTGDQLRKAVEIISTNEYIIPTTLARKYHFTKSVVDAIKSVYSKIS